MNRPADEYRDEPTESLNRRDGSGDDTLVQAVDRYLKAVESGQAPDIDEFVRQFPQLASPLRDCLEALRFVRETVPGEVALAGQFGDDRDPAAVSRTLGDFRILGEIGRGGMGIVYEAEQLSIGRRVALKVLPSASLLDTKSLSRFQHEAQAAGTLKHPNIVGIHAVGCERGVHYYAMELVEGKSLAEVIQDRRTDHSVDSPAVADKETAPLAALSTKGSTTRPHFFGAVAELGIQAALALDHAHQCGIIHRDIKPSNLMVDVDGHLWVTDFGLAQIEDDAAHLTMTGDLLGTLRYMSPEQASGNRRKLDHRTDIYSLGATLYELLAGRPAFDGNDKAKTLRDIAESEPRPLRQLNSRVPVDLETIVMTAMNQEPSDRYTTCGELAADLQRFVDHEPINTRRPYVLRRSVRWCRRNPLVATLLLCLVLMSAATLFVVGQGLRPGPVPEFPVSSEVGMRLVHRGGDELNGNISPDGWRLAFPDWDTANIALFSLKTGGRQDLTTDGTWERPDEFGEEAVWSHDGTRLAYNWYQAGPPPQTELRVIDVDGGNEEVLVRTSQWPVLWPTSWSGDGKYVLVRLWDERDTAALALVDVRHKSLEILKQWQRPFPHWASISPDGQHVVYMQRPHATAAQHDLFMLDVRSRKSRVIHQHPANDRRPCWTPDGRWVVFLSDRGANVGLWALRFKGAVAVGEPRLIHARLGDINPRGFDKRGSYYYVGYQSLRNVYTAAMDAENCSVTSPPEVLPSQYEGRNVSADWSSDGSRMAYLSCLGPEHANPRLRLATCPVASSRNGLRGCRCSRWCDRKSSAGSHAASR